VVIVWADHKSYLAIGQGYFGLIRLGFLNLPAAMRRLLCSGRTNCMPHQTTAMLSVGRNPLAVVVPVPVSMFREWVHAVPSLFLLVAIRLS
jgi:hypothetical protein